MRLRTNSITILLSKKRLAAYIRVSMSRPSLLKLKRSFSLTSEVFRLLPTLVRVIVKMWMSALTRDAEGERGAAAVGQAPREQEDRDQ